MFAKLANAQFRTSAAALLRANHRCTIVTRPKPLGVFVKSEMSSTAPQERLIAVVAFGGNALLRRGEPLTMPNQQHNAARAAAAVASLSTLDHGLRLCITHGNGPQVGLLAQMDAESGLDVLDAETEGQIGYLLELELANALGTGTDVCALLTQVVVDTKDPAFQHPTKPIGRWYSKEEAEALAKEKGWTVAQDGDKWRRVVASPEPKAIVESRAIDILLKAGVVVIACGGGGIPVAVEEGERQRRFGVQAVVDKDAASALLAANINAEWLIMLTDAAAVYDPTQWPDKKVPLPSPIKVSDVEKMKFASGSMGPKMAAAVQFVKKTGGKAAVGNIEDVAAIVKGEAGTVVVAG